MCGICGIFNMNGEPVSSVGLRRMTDAIAIADRMERDFIQTASSAWGTAVWRLLI